MRYIMMSKRKAKKLREPVLGLHKATYVAAAGKLCLTYYDGSKEPLTECVAWRCKYYVPLNMFRKRLK